MILHHLSLYEQLKFFKKTQETFARDLGVSLATVNRWVNKKFKPSQLAKEKIKEVIERYEKEFDESLDTESESSISAAADN